MSATNELTRRFRSAEVAAAFAASYQAVLARWPLEVTSLDVPGEYGTTRVQVCGPPDGKPLVLLHGGGCTSAIWFANVGVLGRKHRVYALDQMGAAGLSVPAGRPIRQVEDFMGWLDALLGELGLESAAFCGHSYGAWLALSYALHSPAKVTRLALLDPTACFAGLSPWYILRAVPLFARPAQQRVRSFIEWETGGLPLDPMSLSLASLGGGEFRGSKVIQPHRPRAEDLRKARAPVLLLLAENSKAHNIVSVQASAERLMPSLTTAILPAATHHSIPPNHPEPLNQQLAAFLNC